MKRVWPMLLLIAGCVTQPQPPPPPAPTPAPTPQIMIPPDPYSDLSPEIQTAIKSNTDETIKSGITTIYPYSPDQQWTINCQPLHATEIRLNDDETTDEHQVILGDSVRWTVRIGEHEVMVEPLGDNLDPHMATNLKIATTTTDGHHRHYTLNLRVRKPDQGAVAWYYPDSVKAAEITREAAIKEAQVKGQLAEDPK